MIYTFSFIIYQNVDFCEVRSKPVGRIKFLSAKIVIKHADKTKLWIIYRMCDSLKFKKPLPHSVHWQDICYYWSFQSKTLKWHFTCISAVNNQNISKKHIGTLFTRWESGFRDATCQNPNSSYTSEFRNATFALWQSYHFGKETTGK